MRGVTEGEALVDIHEFPSHGKAKAACVVTFLGGGRSCQPAGQLPRYSKQIAGYLAHNF